MGGRGDKSFNDGAYIGAMRAVRELGAEVRCVEPGEGSDREAGLRLLAAQHMDLVLGVGFIFSDDLTQPSERRAPYWFSRYSTRSMTSALVRGRS